MKIYQRSARVMAVCIIAEALCTVGHAQLCNVPQPSAVISDYAVSTGCYVAPPPVTYRVVCETVYDEKKVMRQKPVWETQIHERPYTVSRQVAETAMREERYKVRIPITEVEIRDYSYERTKYVQETAVREEKVVVMKPIQRTIEREEVYTVCRPVQETSLQRRQKTINEQVTTYETKYVDRGAYTEQLVMKPTRGLFSSKLEFRDASAVTDECTGQVTKQRAGLYWVPRNTGRYEVEKIWVPNPQPVEVPRTYTVPKTVCEEVPVTVTRMVQEQHVRKVPVTITETVREEQIRKVPYTTMKPVRELVENKIPVKVCKWQEEERVRQVPYTTWKTVCEQRVEKKEVKVCKMVCEEDTIQIPRIVKRFIPVDANGCDIISTAPVLPTPAAAPVSEYSTPAVGTNVNITPAPEPTTPEVSAPATSNSATSAPIAGAPGDVITLRDEPTVSPSLPASEPPRTYEKAHTTERSVLDSTPADVHQINTQK